MKISKGKKVSKADLVLRTLKVTIPYYNKDGEELGYRFNLINPLGYIALLIASIIVGFTDGIDTFLTAITDSMEARLSEIKANKIVAQQSNTAKKQ